MFKKLPSEGNFLRGSRVGQHPTSSIEACCNSVATGEFYPYAGIRRRTRRSLEVNEARCNTVATASNWAQRGVFTAFCAVWRHKCSYAAMRACVSFYSKVHLYFGYGT